MRNVLVTGGAGFIGSNFVRHLVKTDRPRRHCPRQADLCREPREPRRPAREPLPARGRRHRRPGARRRAGRRRTMPWSTSRRSRTTTTRSTIRARSSRPTWSARSRCSRPRASTTCASTTSRPTRSTATSTSTTRSGSPRRRPTTRRAPTRRPRPARTCWWRVGAVVRRTRDDQQLLQQLRPLPARREVHPAPDHPAHRRPQAPLVRRRAQRPRLDPRRRPQQRRPDDPRARAIGETYLIGADGEHNNRDVVAQLLAIFGREPDDFEHVTDRAGHDRRYAIDSGKLRTELGWQPQFADFTTGLADTVDWYRANEHWWRPSKAATESMYARQGQ